MITNNTPISWPMSAEDWMAVERAAKAERARAIRAFGRSVGALVRRAFGAGKPTAIYLPATRGRITA